MEKVNSRSALPLWAQIAETLRRRIAQGDVDPRELSDAALATEFGVSIMTVRQAVQQLVADGLLERQRGKGTFVPRKPVRGPLDVLERNFEDWTFEGGSASARILERTLVAADMSLSAELGVANGTLVGYLKRLRFVGEFPVALDHRYLPAEFNALFSDDELIEHPLFLLLRHKLKQSLKLAHITIRAVSATEEEAEPLDVTVGSPLLDRGIQIVGDDGRVLMTGHSLYHANRFIYTSTLPLDGAQSNETLLLR